MRMMPSSSKDTAYLDEMQLRIKLPGMSQRLQAVGTQGWLRLAAPYNPGVAGL